MAVVFAEIKFDVLAPLNSVEENLVRMMLEELLLYDLLSALSSWKFRFTGKCLAFVDFIGVEVENCLWSVGVLSVSFTDLLSGIGD